MFDFMKVWSFQQSWVHHSLDLLPQPETHLDREGNQDQPCNGEDEAEDHERAGVLQVEVGECEGSQGGGESHGPCGDQEDGSEGEAADHVFVWPSPGHRIEGSARMYIKNCQIVNAPSTDPSFAWELPLLW